MINDKAQPLNLLNHLPNLTSATHFFYIYTLLFKALYK